MKAFILTLCALLLLQASRSQNVGIGILNPSRAPLMVNGSIGNAVAMFGSEKFGVTIGSNNPEIGFNTYNNSGTKAMKPGFAASIGMDSATGSFYLGNFNGNKSISMFDVITGYQKVVTVTQAGNVGIHTVNPSSAFEIYSTMDNALSLPGLRLTVSNFYGQSSWNIFAYNGGAFSRNLVFAREGVQRAVISGLDGTYFSTSDRNCKKQINYIDNRNMLGQLMQLKPASYLMKDEPESSNLQMGFISQDVELIFPGVVSMIGGIKMMNYSGLLPVAIAGIQQQQEEILTLKKENEILKANMEDLRKMILKKLPD